MTREEAKALLPVIQAYAEGKTIERAETVGSEWLSHGVVWHDVDRPCFEPTPGVMYRIKPQPREWWVNVFHGGGCSIWPTKYEADNAPQPARVECIHVREVL